MSNRIITLALLGTVLFGCGGGSDPSSVAVSAQPDGTQAGVAGALAAPVAVLLPPAAGVTMDLQAQVAAALADAAQRTGLDKSALQVIAAEAVTWSDGSLGCPVPGMMYTMALVPGYRIRIQAGAEVLHYHASARGNMILCPAGLVVESSPLDPK